MRRYKIFKGSPAIMIPHDMDDSAALLGKGLRAERAFRAPSPGLEPGT